MKKICALILALMLIFTATAALADLNWSDNEKNAAQIEGEYHTYDEPGLKCWIPTVLRQVELTEDDQKNGFIDYFATADNSSAVAVQYVSAGINTTEDYFTMLNTISEVNDIETITINGLPAVIYTMEATDISCVSIPKGDGYIYEMSFFPMSDDAFSAIAVLIASSIQEK